jgi:hypothetical protein
MRSRRRKMKKKKIMMIMRRRRNAYGLLVAKIEGNIPLVIPRRR